MYKVQTFINELLTEKILLLRDATISLAQMFYFYVPLLQNRKGIYNYLLYTI